MGRVEGLREKLQNSKVLRLDLPIIIAYIARGQRRVILDIDRLDRYLDTDDNESLRLCRKFGLPAKPVQNPRPRLDKIALALEYQQKLNEGHFKNRSELARDLGVSRAWISKLLKTLRN